MDKFTKEEANVLTRAGFLAHYQQLTNAGLKCLDAYEQTEVMHIKVHTLGVRKYSDFSSFIRLKKLVVQINSKRSTNKIRIK